MKENTHQERAKELRDKEVLALHRNLIERFKEQTASKPAYHLPLEEFRQFIDRHLAIEQEYMGDLWR